MIKPAEIQQKARKEGVRDTQIEKDYILSWILLNTQSYGNIDAESSFSKPMPEIRLK